MNDAPGPVAPAGWYPDSRAVDQLRYWDGSSWTCHTSPAGALPTLGTPQVANAAAAAGGDGRHQPSGHPGQQPAGAGAGPDANTVADGVLRAVVVVVAFGLVIALTIALAVKQHEMSSAKNEGEHALDEALAPNASSVRVQLRSEVLADEAMSVRSAAGGPLAGIAGDPGELRDLARRLDQESRRLADLALYEAQNGLG